MTLTEILNAIKNHGVIYVVCVGGFIYLNAKIETLERKYEDCITERINEAYRMRSITKTPVRLVAVLPSNPVGKIKKDEKS